MTPFENQKAKYVDLEDGRTVLDLYETFDQTALFSYVMDNPKHRQTLESLIDARDTSGLYKWMDTLDKNVLSNGLQKSYLADVFRDCVHQKFPQEKVRYDKLQREVNGASISKPPSKSQSPSEPSL